MWPLGAPLHVGVVRVAHSELQIGDLIAFIGTKPNQLWVHRLHGFAEHGILTRGDTVEFSDAPVPWSAIVGRVQWLRLGANVVAVPLHGKFAWFQRQLGLGWAQIAPTLIRQFRRFKRPS